MYVFVQSWPTLLLFLKTKNVVVVVAVAVNVVVFCCCYRCCYQCLLLYHSES